MVRICGTGGTDLGRSLGETRKEKTGNGGIRKEKKKKKWRNKWKEGRKRRRRKGKEEKIRKEKKNKREEKGRKGKEEKIRKEKGKEEEKGILRTTNPVIPGAPRNIHSLIQSKCITISDIFLSMWYNQNV
jgi:hypothetical protein